MGLVLLWCCGSAFAAWPFGGAITRIPVPARDFTVEVEDVGGTRVSLTRASMAGEVFVWGDLGAGQVSIPFEDVEQFSVIAASDPEHRILEVTVRGIEPVRVEVEDDVAWFGRAAWGLYRVEMADIRVVRFSGLTETAQPKGAGSIVR